MLESRAAPNVVTLGAYVTIFDISDLYGDVGFHQALFHRNAAFGFFSGVFLFAFGAVAGVWGGDTAHCTSLLTEPTRGARLPEKRAGDRSGIG